MSSISAGTNTSTALVSTGDTTGQLDLKINGGTQAVRINTSGAIGVGSSPAYGTSGQVLTSGGSGAAPTWATPSTGYSGSTSVSSATDVTLTSSSTQVQYVAMTTSSKYVILPDATTLTKGAGVFTIINQGQYTFGVKDNSGNTIYPGLNGFDSITFALISNSTAAGTWLIIVNNEIVSLLAQANVSASTVTTNIDSFCLLSTTSFLCSYRVLSGTSLSIYVVAGTISGTTATFGTPTLVQTVALDSTYTLTDPARLAKTSSTTAVLVTFYVASGPTETSRAWSIEVSGTTATVGTGNSYATTGSSAGFMSNYVLSLNGTAAIIFTRAGSTPSFTVRIATSSGTTLTIGSANTLPSSPDFYAGSLNGVIAADKFYWSDVNNGLYIFSVSGTTITRGTKFASSATIGSTTLTLSSTEFLTNQTLVTYSGTTVSSAVAQPANASLIAGDQAKIGSAIYTATQKQNVSGSVVFSAGTVGSTTASGISNLTALDSTTLVAGCMSNLGYLSIIFVKVL